jgi:hypothetical protein
MNGSPWPLVIGTLAVVVMFFLSIPFMVRAALRDNPLFDGAVHAGTARVTGVARVTASTDQRDWYRVAVDLDIPELSGSDAPNAPVRRFEFEPNDRPLVGDTWSVEVSADNPSRYRVVTFPRRSGSSRGVEQSHVDPRVSALDSRIGKRNLRGPVRIGTDEALAVHRITEARWEDADRYHFVITLRVTTPGHAPYDVVGMYRNMKTIRPYEGERWEVQVSEDDPHELAVFFERPVPA